VIVIGPERPVAKAHPVHIHQPPQTARVLGHQHIRRRQQVERAQRDVARRADRRGDQIQPSSQFLLVGIHHWTRSI